MGKFILREGVNTNIDGRDYGPGDEVELDDEQGKRLHEQGVVDPAGSAKADSDKRAKAADEQSSAEQQAEKDAADLEANKVRTAEANRAAQSQPAPVAAKTPVAKK